MTDKQKLEIQYYKARIADLNIHISKWETRIMFTKRTIELYNQEIVKIVHK